MQANISTKYQATLNWLYEQLPMYQRLGNQAFKKDLTNTLALCKILDNPHKKITCIHIAGTNGKGSTAHMLAAIFQTHGYKTGLYTSPHLLDFRERIKINGEMIEQEQVIDFVSNIKPLLGDLKPSFFEFTVAMAFDYFAKEAVEIAVIETGLGGRLDSTNVITPILSIITNIDWDHMDMLGNTLPLIAAEKAGIIKADVPVIIGETHKETKPVFDAVSNEKRAPIRYADQIFKADVKKIDFSSQLIEVNRLKKIFDVFALDLTGNYQTNNLQTVLAALDFLEDYGYSFELPQTKLALSRVKEITGLRGRFEWLSHSPPILVDTGHNQAGVTLVWKQVAKLPFKKHRVVLGCVSDKDLQKILPIFPTNASYYFCAAQIPRALPANILAEKASNFGLTGTIHNSVIEALNAAVNNCSTDDLVLVLGSTFTVAEALLWQR